MFDMQIDRHGEHLNLAARRWSMESQSRGTAARHTFLFALVCCLMLPAVLHAAGTVTESSGLRVRSVQYTDAGVRLILEFDAVHRNEQTVAGETVSLPQMGGASYLPRAGEAAVPVFTSWARLAPNGTARVVIRECEYETIPLPSPATWDAEGQPTAFADRTDDTWYPASHVTLGEPGVFREFRVANLHIKPVQVNPARGEARVCRSMEIEIVQQNDVGHHAIDNRPSELSESFLPFYRTFIDWQDSELDDYEIVRRPIAVLAASDLISLPAFHEWLDWKRKRGEEILVVTQNETEWTHTAIHDYLITLYEETRFSYLHIIGSEDWPFAVPPSEGSQYGGGDYHYARLDGEDWFPDVHVGRTSFISNNQQWTTYANKVLRYERDIQLLDTERLGYGITSSTGTGWGEGVVGVQHMPRTWMLAQQYTQVDTFYQFYQTPLHILEGYLEAGVGYWTNIGYLVSSPLHDSVDLPEDVLSFFSDLSEMDNWSSYSGLTYIESAVALSTPVALRGAVAAIGIQTADNSPMILAAASAGVNEAVHLQNVRTTGQALTGGWLNVIRTFEEHDLNRCHYALRSLHLCGDPTVWLQKGVPGPLEVDAPLTVVEGQSMYAIEVQDEQSNPVEGALVAVVVENESENRYEQTTELTGADGTAFPVLLAHDGDTITFTVSHGDFIPFQSEINVGGTDASLGITMIDVSDDPAEGAVGDCDGLIEAGETVLLRPIVQNFGSGEETGVTITASTEDDWGSFTVGTLEYGTLAAGEEFTPENALLLEIERSAQHRWVLRVDLLVEGSESSRETAFDLVLNAPTYAMVSHESSLPPQPGTTTELSFEIVNAGETPGEDGIATLLSHSEFLEIIDNEVAFESISNGEAATIGPFTVHATNASTPGYPAQVTLLTADGNSHEDTLRTVVNLGEVDATDPAGPDTYGYYAYDDSDDNYLHAPVFDWVEIDPSAEDPDFNGTAVCENAYEVEVIELPFTVQFYGVEYDTITVSPDGWVALGNRYGQMQPMNHPLPSPASPAAIIAPYYEDLTFNDENVYSYLDEETGRFILEWSAVHVNDFQHHPGPYSFEVIFHDHEPGEGPESGDHEFTMQYLDLTPQPGNSYDSIRWPVAGIQDHTYSRGLQLYYFDHYHAGSSVIEPERAIRFTTEPWQDTGSLDEPGPLPRAWSIDRIWPNPFNDHTRMSVALPEAGRLEIVLYDLLGREVRTLLREEKPAGYHMVSIDAAGLPGGVYFVRTKWNSRTDVRKLVLVR
ncbi:T9SS type A sorting domain-containing protein [bacterium]|nr:T9SS type A sorting domain-containing protein [bacterium]